MADKKISQMTLLSAADLDPAADYLPIVDPSEPNATDQNKRILAQALLSGGLAATVANGVVYVNGSELLTTGSGLQFDGTSLGVGVTAYSGFKLEVQSPARFSENAIAAGGSAVELGWSSGGNTGFVQAHDRIASQFKVLTLNNSMRLASVGDWTPVADGTQNLGSGALRMATLYAATGTINTSDAREKTPVRGFTDAELSASRELRSEIGVYQFLKSVELKGDAARQHVGMTVQRAIEVMESHGLDPMAYGFICYDKWDAETRDEVAEDGEFERQVTRQRTEQVEEKQVEVIDGVPTLTVKAKAVPVFDNVQVVDADGNAVEGLTHAIPAMETAIERYNVVTVREAGDRYSFRPDQLTLFMMAGIE